MSWIFSQAADPGGRSQQQDRIAIFPMSQPDRHLLVLADGMGGHRHGGAAAQLVLDTARDYIERPESGSPLDYLESLCYDAHLGISGIDEGCDPGVSVAPPGSTAVILLVSDDEAYWAHVGDSRLSLLRNGKVLKQTRDHSLREMQTADGIIQRSALYMCLGGSKVPQPATDFIGIEPGDTLLLSSDGYWEQVAMEETIARLGRRTLQPNAAVDLVRLARQRGGVRADNISLLIAQWRVPPKRKPLQRIVSRLRGRR